MSYLILASFFDPTDNGFDIGDMIPITIVGGIIFALLAWLLDLRIRAIVARTVDPLRAELHDRTAPIQPDSNGGKSLADTSRKLDLLIEHLHIPMPPSMKADDH